MATTQVIVNKGVMKQVAKATVEYTKASSPPSKSSPPLCAQVTSKPKSEKTLTRNPSQKSMEKGPSKETILLRQPTPKYSFLAKTSKPTNQTPPLHVVSGANKSPGSVQPVLSSANSDIKPEVPVVNVVPSAVVKPVNKVDPFSNVSSTNSPICTTNRFPGTVVSASLPSKIDIIPPVLPCPTNDNTSQLLSAPISEPHRCPWLESLPFPEPSGVNIELHAENTKLKAEMEKMKMENDTLKRQIDVQFQVNSELKKLLVASVGDDLQFRVENLARDKAQLSSEIGTFAKKHSEDYEHIDKISIQADMWRSKYLASKVMVDELASTKAFLSLHVQESQSTLQQMMNERHELRRNLLESYRILRQVKSAFDPLNKNTVKGSVATNSLDLARMNQRLSEAIRFRLLPSNVSLDTEVDMDVWTDNLTYAETKANEFLSKTFNFEDKKGIESASRVPSSPVVIDRFHPFTRFDNLTLNCCPNCKGDLSAV